MVQVTNPDGVVQEIIAEGGSVTVPAGEVWQVKLLGLVDYGAGGHVPAIQIDSNAELRLHGGSVQYKYVFSAGTTISNTSSTGNDRKIWLNGYDVSSTIENSIVYEQLNESPESFTVPAGETWQVWINMHTDYDTISHDSQYSINGQTGHWTPGIRQNYLPIVLEGGDTVESVSSDTDDRRTVVSGYKL